MAPPPPPPAATGPPLLAAIMRRAAAWAALQLAVAAVAPPPAARCPVRGGVVYVDECGDGFRARDAAGQPDHTEVIQAALNSTAHTVVLRNLSAATPWVSRPLFVTRSDSTLRFEARAFLHAKRGRDCRRAGQPTCFSGPWDSMLQVLAPRNVSIVGGTDATIRMWRQDCELRTAPLCPRRCTPLPTAPSAHEYHTAASDAAPRATHH